MGISKKEWFESENENQENWKIKKCTHCDECYRFNVITDNELAPENGWCKDCYYTIILGKN